jgi:glutamate--cysteine ligase
MDSHSPAIADVDPLVAYMAGGCKPRSEFRLGVEHERVAVVVGKDGEVHPLAYDGPGGIEQLLRTLQAQRGWNPIEEHGRPIALKRDHLSITLEPGGQIEYSGSPLRSVREIADEMTAHYRDLESLYAPLGIRLLGVGYNPYFRRDEIPWVPKGRYAVMREYFKHTGTRGHDMMLRTATIQANLDFSDQRDASRKLRGAMGISAVVTALFANSPWAERKRTGLVSTRSEAWLDTDNARAGLLELAFADGADDQLFRRYAEWALDVPMFFIYRQGGYRSLAGQGFSFRRFMAEGQDGERATLADWVLHLSTLFPDVRLKRYLEVRSADSVPLRLAPGFAAFWKGLLYSETALEAMVQLTAGWSFAERVRLRAEVPRGGLKVREPGGRPLSELATELLKLAEAGLDSDERGALAELFDIARDGRTLAERLVADHGDSPPPPDRLAA